MFNKKDYVPYWRQFSEYIRFERAQNKCEKCGAKNDSINRHGSKVVLTVAHLDSKTGICKCKKIYGFKCAKPNHVLAMCNFCHLSYDRPMHLAKRKETLIKRKDSERGLFKFE